MNKSILIILPANDFNEIEFNTVVSKLKIQSIQTFIASDSHSVCTGSKGMKVGYDVKLFNVHPNNFDGIILIGGNGVIKYWDNQSIHKILREFNLQEKIIAAICAAPVVLSRAGLTKGKFVSCFPKVGSELEKDGSNYTEKPISIEDNIITCSKPEYAETFTDVVLSKINS